ncbi:hypothetical protein ZHAS_00005799 [Anopheles sinensis]|uniref:Uncharacterized protein n=1 Tax=Anopheles sinensis TaxID=74873 RepID=A0A084VKE1_ANOSI|nr:hypothetical protein ZHAS_00005799 [Anopheles sinensis]
METPYSYLQVDIQEYPTPIEFPPPFSIEEFNLYHHGYPPHMNYDKNAFYMNQLASATAPKENKTEIIKTEPSAQPPAGNAELSPASIGHEEPGKNVLMKQLIRAKHTLQQRIKRQNETPEQKALRRQRNAELNRKRRQNKEDIRVTIEKTKNRLRQRIKREIDRMLRTRQKRDDFLRETFEQMATVFSEADMMQFQERVASVIGEIGGDGEGSRVS